MSTRLGPGPFAAPALIELELASVCAKKCRRLPSERPRLVAAYARWTKLDLTTFAIPGEAALRLALDHQLTPYDAAYLLLARHLGAPLVTLDARLAAAIALFDLSVDATETDQIRLTE